MALALLGLEAGKLRLNILYLLNFKHELLSCSNLHSCRAGRGGRGQRRRRVEDGEADEALLAAVGGGGEEGMRKRRRRGNANGNAGDGGQRYPVAVASQAEVSCVKASPAV